MRRVFCLAAILAFSGVVSACQSSSTGVLGPSGSKCTISLPASLQAIGAEGGTGSLPIAVAPECTWSVSSATDWIVITSSTSGQGTGVVEYVASANPRASERRGALLVSERRVELTQAAASCQLALAPSSVAVSASGGEGVIAVNATEGCEWSATSDADWLTILTASSGNGAGALRFRADANGGPARSGNIRVGNRTVSVQQHGIGAACAFAIGGTETVLPAAGGTEVIGVTGPANCPWTAQSHESWILVTGGASGSGNGNVTLTIAPNLGAQRSGTATIAGNTYYVTQQAAVSVPVPCSFVLDSTSDTVGALGETLQIGVTAGSGCSWTTSSHAPWITVLSGGGVGNGVARLAVAPNLGAARVGTATIAGRAFTVTQQAAIPTCTYALSPTRQQVPPNGGNFSVQITTQPACGWTAESRDSWITLTSSSTGSGSGILHYEVDGGLLLGSRTGEIEIAGRILFVDQSALLLGADDQ